MLCDTLMTMPGGMAPDLKFLEKTCGRIASKAAKGVCCGVANGCFKIKVLAGEKNSEGRNVMSACESVFPQEAIWVVKGCIDARTIEGQVHRKI